MNTVTFHSQANGSVELQAESDSNLWIIRFNSDGTKTLLRNMKPVASLLSTPLTRALNNAAGVLEERIREYMASPSNDLFWLIKGQLSEMEVSA